MRSVPDAMTDAWKSAAKGGDEARPVVRATLLVTDLNRFEYDTAWATGGSTGVVFDKHRTGTFTSIIFGDHGPLRELRNIKSISWNRSTDQDVATCTLTLLNNDISPMGDPSETDSPEDFDQPGFFTYNRGSKTIDQNRWGHEAETGWRDIIVPDRLVRTYEGYGCDMTVPAALDENLMQSGTWLIDKVTYTADGEIQIEMRDVGRILIDQIVFPPVIPYNNYPLSWTNLETIQVDGRDCTGGSWDFPKGKPTSSNSTYIGQGLTDPPYPNYVGPTGGVQGHHPAHALNDSAESYWLSTGQTTPGSKVYWEIAFNDHTTAINGVHINPKGGPYRVYISLENDKGWIGKKKIPYDVTTEGVDLHAGIPFVETVIADRAWPFDVTLPRKYKNIKRMRLTFTHLWDTRVGNYPWRAALQAVKVYTAPHVSDLGFAKGTVQKLVGNYADYTQIIKWTCAWGGFFWPPHKTKMDFIQLSGTEAQTVSYAHADPILPIGRVWGDFMRVGTAGVAPLTMDLFDKRPLMDMISYVRDIVGFLFFIDETGAVVWRKPNLWSLGNYMSPSDLGVRTRARSTNIVTIDEEETLLSYSTTLDSADLRERIFVANSSGKYGTVGKGFTPYPVNFRRTAGWTDQHFANKNETRVMVDLIAAQSMFNYRRSKLTIPGYPAIQIDDQIRIFERVTNETYYHYVLGVTNNLDMSTGEWTYELDTHWLGERPQDAWAVKVDELQDVTKAYLDAISEDTN